MSAPREPSLIERFIAWEASGSVALLLATAVALGWANSPWADSYHHLLELPLGLSVADRAFSLSVHHWVNDGLMAVFFFVVGLEIKSEVVLGQLSSLKGAVLPVAAALGGIVAPALLYAALNAGGEGARGWGIPMATDIAFALGVLALLGRRAPLGLKVFLTALAIADDLGAVLVISTYYTERIELRALGAAGGLLLVLALVQRLKLRVPGLVPLLVGGVWLAVLASGVHATVAGILVALLVPVRSPLEPRAFLAGVAGSLRALEAAPLSRESLVFDGAQLEHLERLHETARRFRPPALALEHALHPFTTWVVLPLFALANAGVSLEGGVGDALRSPAALGVVLGLAVGKPLGITLASWLVVRLGVGALPPGLGFRHLLGAGMLGGHRLHHVHLRVRPGLPRRAAGGPGQDRHPPRLGAVRGAGLRLPAPGAPGARPRPQRGVTGGAGDRSPGSPTTATLPEVKAPPDARQKPGRRADAQSVRGRS